MIHNELEEIRSALTQVPGVKSVTRTWPVGAYQLPCIAIARASQTPLDARDGSTYLSEVTVYVRIFTGTASEGDAIAPLADAQMEKLGYTCVFAADEDDGKVRIQAMRYRKFM